MKITFIGHLSKDINVVKGNTHILYGGGVFHSSITAQRLGAEATLLTKCAAKDKPHFSELMDAGVSVVFLPSQTTTSIRNEYPTDNPDDRRSFILSRAEPFYAHELEAIDTGAAHINPLWYGEFQPELIPALRSRVKLLGADAQGFLRRVLANGGMEYRDWPEKERYLPLFDLFKVDLREAQILTHVAEIRLAVRRLRKMGTRTVVLTHHAGVCVYDGANYCESVFSSYTNEGRTGRGDTCMAAFMVNRTRMDTALATQFAAHVTSEKMQYRGAFRGKLLF